MSFWNDVKSLFCQVTHSCSRRDVIRKDKAVRSKLSEKQIDKMVQDSFPASDPPSNY